ncbi:MAG TPA: COX15/CtaA family protein [Planctomycetota bacterium]|nr:COX15/CtaA family protein [Planctomycetota bacterium]
MAVDAEMRAPAATTRAQRGRADSLAIFARVLAIGTFAVVSAGTVVTSTRSGLADRHWPLFSGRLLPSFSEMLNDFALFWEHGHRAIAGSMVVLTAVFAVCLARSSGKPRWLKRLGVLSAVVIVLPAILGGLTVLAELRIPGLSIFHVSVAMLALSLNAALAVLTGPRWRSMPEAFLTAPAMKPEDAAWVARGAAASAAAVYVQIILGALPRHMDVGVVPHIITAFLVFTLVVLVASRVLGRHSRAPGLLGPSMALLALVFVQFFLGFTTFIVRPAGAKAPGSGLYEVSATLHIVAGALMLVISVVFLLRALRLRQLVDAREAPGLAAGGVA